MTPDEIEKAAIEAAHDYFQLRRRAPLADLPWREVIAGVTRAYEARMVQHFDDAPRDGTAILAKHFHFGWIEVRYLDRGSWITRDGREITNVTHLTHFRPLPKPGGV